MTLKGKKIRRILWIMMAVILLPSLSFWAYLQYQIKDSYKTKIPASTTAIIKIDIHAIYKSMLGEFFNKKNNSPSSRFKGIGIPANIFLYTLKGRQVTTVFSSLPIENITAFEHSLSTWNGLQPKHPVTNGVNVFTNPEETVIIAYNHSKVAFAYSMNREHVIDDLVAILQDRNMIAIDNTNFRKIEEQGGHIAFLGGENKGSLYFNKGNVHTIITLSGNGLKIPSQINHQHADKENAVNMWLYAGWESALAGKNYSFGNFSVNGDSIVAAHPEGIEFTIGKPVTQRDSVVTYEYNDDFEKVATTTVKENIIPGLYCKLKVNPKLLLGYLERQNIVFVDSGVVNKEVFPLYQLYVTQRDTHFDISTLKTNIQNAAAISSPDFFSLDVNFEKLIQQQEFAILKKYIINYKELNARGRKNKGHDVTIEANLYLKNSGESALLQLLRSF